MKNGKQRKRKLTNAARPQRHTQLKYQDTESTIDFLQVNTSSVKEKIASEIEAKLLDLKDHFDNLSSELRGFLKSK